MDRKKPENPAKKAFRFGNFEVLPNVYLSPMAGVTDLVLDFADVEYISSGGLRLLLLTEQEMENRNGALTVTHVNDHVRSILDMSGFLTILKVV